MPLERKVAQLILVGFDGPGPERGDLPQPAPARPRRHRDRRPQLHERRAARPARRRGRGDRVAGAPRPAVRDGAAGGRRLQRVPRPAAGRRAASDLAIARQAGRRGRAAAAGALRAARPQRRARARSSTSGSSDDPALGPRAFADDPARGVGIRRAPWSAPIDAARVFSAAAHFPGLGVGVAVHRRRPGQRRPLARGAARARPRAVPRRDPRRRAGGARRPRALHDRLLRDARVAVARRSSRTCCATSSGSRAWRSPTTSSTPARDGARNDPRRRGRVRQRRAPTCSTSRGPAGAQQAAYVALLRAVRKGEISRERIDEAVDRILLAKRDYGVLRLAKKVVCAPIRRVRRRTSPERRSWSPVATRRTKKKRPHQRDPVQGREGRGRGHDAGQEARRRGRAPTSGTTKQKRSAAGVKAAATRKRNAAARSNSAKKAARDPREGQGLGPELAPRARGGRVTRVRA